VSPTKSAAAPEPGTPKSGSTTRESTRSMGRSKPSAQNKFEHTKNGKSDGTITRAQSPSADTQAALAALASTISHT